MQQRVQDDNNGPRRKPAAPPAAGPVIVTVHGTNDADAAEEGKRWWQRGSVFTTVLIGQLQARGVAGVEIRPVHWSGANSDFDRFSGSAALAKTLHDLEKAKRPHAVIAHSHGGNVTMEALLMRRARAAPVPSIVTFGTPFFRRNLKLVPWLIAAFQTLLGVVIVPIMIWYLVTVLGSDSNKKIEAAVFFGSIAVIALLSFRKGWHELRRNAWSPRRLVRAVGAERWLVVHSPRDEAMRLLETAAALSPKYVTVGAAVRSLTAFGTFAGVAAAFSFFLLLWRYFLDPIIAKVQAGEFGLGTAADLTFLLIFPLVYAAVYAIVWAFARLGGGWLYAKVLSGAIHGGLIGAAYGGDGRFKLTGVTRSPPHRSGVKEVRIDALNLGGIDEKAVFQSAQKLYDSIVASDAESAGIGDPDKMWKRLSDALYHNAYMRDDGVIASVADHLAAGWRKP